MGNPLDMRSKGLGTRLLESSQLEERKFKLVNLSPDNLISDVNFVVVEKRCWGRPVYKRNSECSPKKGNPDQKATNHSCKRQKWGYS